MFSQCTLHALLSATTLLVFIPLPEALSGKIAVSSSSNLLKQLLASSRWFEGTCIQADKQVVHLTCLRGGAGRRGRRRLDWQSPKNSRNNDDDSSEWTPDSPEEARHQRGRRAAAVSESSESALSSRSESAEFSSREETARRRTVVKQPIRKKPKAAPVVHTAAARRPGRPKRQVVEAAKWGTRAHEELELAMRGLLGTSEESQDDNYVEQPRRKPPQKPREQPKQAYARERPVAVKKMQDVGYNHAPFGMSGDAGPALSRTWSSHNDGETLQGQANFGGFGLEEGEMFGNEGPDEMQGWAGEMNPAEHDQEEEAQPFSFSKIHSSSETHASTQQQQAPKPNFSFSQFQPRVSPAASPAAPVHVESEIVHPIHASVPDAPREVSVSHSASMPLSGEEFSRPAALSPGIFGGSHVGFQAATRTCVESTVSGPTLADTLMEEQVQECMTDESAAQQSAGEGEANGVEILCDIIDEVERDGGVISLTDKVSAMLDGNGVRKQTPYVRVEAVDASISEALEQARKALQDVQALPMQHFDNERVALANIVEEVGLRSQALKTLMHNKFLRNSLLVPPSNPMTPTSSFTSRTSVDAKVREQVVCDVLSAKRHRVLTGVWDQLLTAETEPSTSAHEPTRCVYVGGYEGLNAAKVRGLLEAGCGKIEAFDWNPAWSFATWPTEACAAKAIASAWEDVPLVVLAAPGGKIVRGGILLQMTLKPSERPAVPAAVSHPLRASWPLSHGYVKRWVRA